MNCSSTTIATDVVYNIYFQKVTTDCYKFNFQGYACYQYMCYNN